MGLPAAVKSPNEAGQVNYRRVFVFHILNAEKEDQNTDVFFFFVFLAVLCVVTQRSVCERCVTKQRTAA